MGTYRLRTALLVLLTAVGSHLWTRSYFHVDNDEPAITGIGGIFFKAKDPQALRNWYEKHLDFKTNQYGTVFVFGKENGEQGHLQWSAFSEKTTFFERDYMINYRVRNLEGLVKQLRNNGVTVTDSIQAYDYGKFVHILDGEGTKIELWEPVDGVFYSYTDEAITNK